MGSSCTSKVMGKNNIKIFSWYHSSRNYFFKEQYVSVTSEDNAQFIFLSINEKTVKKIYLHQDKHLSQKQATNTPLAQYS
jgi:hypothetical protein